MDANIWIERLYDDAALTDGLTDVEAEQVLSWAESHLATCETEAEARHLIDSIRLLNRFVQGGESFEQLFLALRANATSMVADRQDTMSGTLDPGTETIYPTEG